MKKSILLLVLFVLYSFLPSLNAQTVKEMSKKLDSLAAIGQYRTCLSLSDLNIEICKNEAGDTSFSYANALLKRGIYKAAAEDYEGWEAQLEATKKQIERTKATEKQMDFLWLRYAHVGGLFAFRLGNFSEAERWFYKKWQSSVAYFGENANETIAAYINYGLTLVQQEKLLQSKQILEAALKMFDKNPHPDSNAMAICYRNLGVIANQVGDFETYEANAKKGFEMQTRLGRTSEALLDQKSIVDGMIRRGEDFAQIRAMYDALVLGNQQEYGEKSVAYASILTSSASFLLEVGLLEKAKQQFDSAKKVFDEQGTDITETEEYWYYLSNCQALYGKLNDKKNQILLLEELARLKQNREKDEWYETLVVLSNLVTALWENGQYEQSNHVLLELENHKNFANLGFEDQFEVINMLYQAYFLRGDWEKTKAYLTQFEELTQKKCGFYSPFWSVVLNEKCRFYKKINQHELYLAALNDYGNCLKQRQKTQILSWTERERILFSAVWSDYTNDLIASKSQKIGEKLANSAIYQQVLMKKAALSNLNHRLKTAVLADSNNETIEIYRNWVEAKEKIAHLKTLSVEKVTLFGYDLDSIQREADRFELNLAIKSKTFKDFKPLTQPNWTEIQQQLPQNSAAIDIVQFQEATELSKTAQTGYAIFILKPSSKEPHILFLKNGNELVNLFYEQYATEIKAGKTPSRKVYEAFWGVIEPFLKDVNTIYFAPDGIFHQINLATLRGADGLFLTEKYAIRNLQSMGELLIPATDLASNGSKTAVLIGNPQFDLAENLRVGASQAQNWRGILEEETDGSAPTLSPLPASKKEVLDIANLLKINGFATEMLLDTAATEVNLKLKKSPTVLHTATHGHFLKSPKREKMLFDEQEAADNPMLRAMLFFSGAQNTLREQSLPARFGDGVFTAYEATNLSLEGTELVVLSACDSGLGKIEHGEGVFGLQRAFRFAGANYVLMSLWAVEDTATQQFMTAFYKNWMGGNTIPDAFRMTQQAMILAKMKPIDWGGWVLLGK